MLFIGASVDPAAAAVVDDVADRAGPFVVADDEAARATLLVEMFADVLGCRVRDVLASPADLIGARRRAADADEMTLGGDKPAERDGRASDGLAEGRHEDRAAGVFHRRRGERLGMILMI
jgi:hypothetical protein